MTMGVYIMEMPTFNTLATSYCSEESTKTYVVMRESGAFWPIRVQLGGESLKKQKWEYTITNGITGVIISFIMLTIFGGLALWFRLSRNGAIIIGIILVIFASLAFFLALYRTLFFRVLIDKDGFFYQTAPGNGRYYHYYTIRQIWVTDAHAKRDFRIFCIVIHRSLHTLQMQGATVKTAAPHSAIFLVFSDGGCLGLLPYFGAERQIVVHCLMKLFLQALCICGLEVH